MDFKKFTLRVTLNIESWFRCNLLSSLHNFLCCFLDVIHLHRSYKIKINVLATRPLPSENGCIVKKL